MTILNQIVLFQHSDSVSFWTKYSIIIQYLAICNKEN